ncbi:hypothetical protein D3C76_1642760 [compost metagenome]
MLVSLSYKSSIPFNAPKVFAKFKMPVTTATIIMPTLNSGFPNKKKSKVSDALSLTVSSSPKNIANAAHPMTMPMSREYLLILFGSVTLTITISNIMMMERRAIFP